MVRVRLQVLLTRLTLGVLHAFIRVWLASSHFPFLHAVAADKQVYLI